MNDEALKFRDAVGLNPSTEKGRDNLSSINSETQEQYTNAVTRILSAMEKRGVGKFRVPVLGGNNEDGKENKYALIQRTGTDSRTGNAVFSYKVGQAALEDRGGTGRKSGSNNPQRMAFAAYMALNHAENLDLLMDRAEGGDPFAYNLLGGDGAKARTEDHVFRIWGDFAVEFKSIDEVEEAISYTERLLKEMQSAPGDVSHAEAVDDQGIESAGIEFVDGTEMLAIVYNGQKAGEHGAITQDEKAVFGALVKEVGLDKALEEEVTKAVHGQAKSHGRDEPIPAGDDPWQEEEQATPAGTGTSNKEEEPGAEAPKKKAAMRMYTREENEALAGVALKKFLSGYPENSMTIYPDGRELTITKLYGPASGIIKPAKSTGDDMPGIAIYLNGNKITRDEFITWLGTANHREAFIQEFNKEFDRALGISTEQPHVEGPQKSPETGYRDKKTGEMPENQYPVDTDHAKEVFFKVRDEMKNMGGPVTFNFNGGKVTASAGTSKNGKTYLNFFRDGIDIAKGVDGKHDFSKTLSFIDQDPDGFMKAFSDALARAKTKSEGPGDGR